MSASAVENHFTPGAPRARRGLAIDTTPWGYVIRDAATASRLGVLAASAGRFIGVILMMAGAGLFVLPDSVVMPETTGMKLGAMVMFTIVGCYLFWAGRSCTKGEYQVDVSRREVRIGCRNVKGNYRLRSTLPFDEIASVFVLRSKEASRPARLFLRIGTGEDAIEVAAGGQIELEQLRDQLIDDLKRPNHAVKTFGDKRITPRRFVVAV